MSGQLIFWVLFLFFNIIVHYLKIIWNELLFVFIVWYNWLDYWYCFCSWSCIMNLIDLCVGDSGLFPRSLFFHLFLSWNIFFHVFMYCSLCIQHWFSAVLGWVLWILLIYACLEYFLFSPSILKDFFFFAVYMVILCISSSWNIKAMLLWILTLLKTNLIDW